MFPLVTSHQDEFWVPVPSFVFLWHWSLGWKHRGVFTGSVLIRLSPLTWVGISVVVLSLLDKRNTRDQRMNAGSLGVKRLQESAQCNVPAGERQVGYWSKNTCKTDWLVSLRGSRLLFHPTIKMTHKWSPSVIFMLLTSQAKNSQVRVNFWATMNRRVRAFPVPLTCRPSFQTEGHHFGRFAILQLLQIVDEQRLTKLIQLNHLTTGLAALNV